MLYLLSKVNLARNSESELATNTVRFGYEKLKLGHWSLDRTRGHVVKRRLGQSIDQKLSMVTKLVLQIPDSPG